MIIIHGSDAGASGGGPNPNSAISAASPSSSGSPLADCDRLETGSPDGGEAKELNETEGDSEPLRFSSDSEIHVRGGEGMRGGGSEPLLSLFFPFAV